MYLYIKVVHLAAIISWMAAVLYHYRLLINMVDNQSKHQDVFDTLCGMASRLYRYILIPAMAVSYAAGVCLAWLNPGLFEGAAYMHAKIALVIVLTIVSIMGGRLMKAAKSDARSLPSSIALRFLNEVPTVIMLLVLFLVVVRPF